MDQQRPDPEPIRVVLAEDHTLVREGTRQILERTGTVSVVAEAADGRQAVEVVDRHEPDVAIIDIGMPGINGIEATRIIKQQHPQVSVLVLSMHDDEEFIFAVLDAGAAGYLLKDVAGHQLINAVEAVHAGESVLHPAVAHKILVRLASREGRQGRPETGCALTSREIEVLRLAARGMANKQIGLALDLSVRTVQAHLSSVFHKLGVGSRTEAVLQGLRRGWFSIEELEPPP